MFPPPINVFVRDRVLDTTSLASVHHAGNTGGNGDSLPSGISENGRFVLFESSASDLVTGDTNGTRDVFVRDLVLQTTLLVSRGLGGACGNGDSRDAVMTPDGRYVAFVSAATNLVMADTNRVPDVFVRDLLSGTTALVSVGAIAGNALQPGAGSHSPRITPDGTHVAFFSAATNLVPGSMLANDVYVRDLIAGSTAWASIHARQVSKGTVVASFNPRISDDGKFVVFIASTNASIGFLPRKSAVLRHDLESGATTILHSNAYVSTQTYQSLNNLDMSPDGQFVAFVGSPPGSAGETSALYLWKTSPGSNVLASLPQEGGLCASPKVSADGRFVTFLGATTSEFHLYRWDHLAGSTVRVDEESGEAPAVFPSAQTALSSDGNVVAFESMAALVANDSNRESDVYVRDLRIDTPEWVSAPDPALPGGGPVLSWLAGNQVDFHVQFKEHWNENHWRDVIGNILFIGKRAYVRDLAPAADARFYRIVSE
ncbi:MAG TPA: hypothetical protein VEH04_19935 [Verrucomicrobiae bacterium]|nr:hypothetical protein [Verrucomicrobiae bacterium]